jgi:voltage-gated potassium channel
MSEFEDFSGRGASAGFTVSGSADHFILCGVGRTTRAVLEEMTLTGRKFVLVEREAEACEKLREFLPAEAVLHGNATDEDVLVAAGAKKARALAAMLPQDKVNLVVAVTALGVNPGLRVLCRCDEKAQAARLRRAGAIPVSTAHVGGRRLATGMIHPEGTGFLNEMLAAPSERPVRFEAVVVAAGGPAEGKTLGEMDLFRRTGLRIAALAKGTAGEFLCNPGAATRLAAEDRLVVIGDLHQVDRLAALVGRWE